MAERRRDRAFDGNARFTDVEQRRRFAPYWYAIRPVSGLIRQRLLQRIARVARSTSA